MWVVWRPGALIRDWLGLSHGGEASSATLNGTEELKCGT